MILMMTPVGILLFPVLFVYSISVNSKLISYIKYID